MIIRVQFYIRFRGREDVLLSTSGGQTADQLARFAVDTAIHQSNRRWPAAENEELHLVGGEVFEQ